MPGWNGFALQSGGSPTVSTGLRVVGAERHRYLMFGFPILASEEL